WHEGADGRDLGSGHGSGLNNGENPLKKLFNSIFSYKVDTSISEPIVIDEEVLETQRITHNDSTSDLILKVSQGAAISSLTYNYNKLMSILSGGTTALLDNSKIENTFVFDMVSQTTWEGTLTYNLITKEILSVNTTNICTNTVTSLKSVTSSLTHSGVTYSTTQTFDKELIKNNYPVVGNKIK